MKKLCVLTLLLSVVGCAPETQGDEPLSLEAQEQSLGACTATASCQDNIGSVSCQGASSCAVNQTARPPSVTCDGVTTACPVPYECFIGGETWSNGTPNPTNECQWCDTRVSTLSWTNRDGYYTGGGGYCKSVSSRCIGGPCSDRYCESSADCATMCWGGQRVCGGGVNLE